jgi:hypothetical protein
LTCGSVVVYYHQLYALVVKSSVWRGCVLWYVQLICSLKIGIRM